MEKSEVKVIKSLSFDGIIGTAYEIIKEDNSRSYKVIVSKVTYKDIDDCVCTFVTVVDPDLALESDNKHCYFIALAHRYTEEYDLPDKYGYEDMQHIVAKMLAKDVNSKYFKNHHLEEHNINGGCPLTKSEKEILIRFIDRIKIQMQLDEEEE